MVLTRKFVDGMALYRELWKGPVMLVCEPDEKPGDSLDNVQIDLDTAPFQTVCENFSGDRFRRLLSARSLVLASVGEQFNAISTLCREAGAACVYITEYSLRTRLQIVREYQPTLAHGLWRSWNQVRQERAQVRAISLADAVQCNGTPTYLAYKALTPSPHLFFDTRSDEAAFATPAGLSARLDRFEADRVLRLVFSGRLTAMKGVDDLPLVADHLRRLGIPFEMSICGAGDLEQRIRHAVTQLGLDEVVNFRGTLDFNNGLVPFVTNETDLFICCHRQGDPSCTYLETMACGVPIAGYANEAFEGLAQASDVGWVTPIGKPLELARRVAEIYRDPGALRAASRRSLEFAREHSFEKTFQRRIEHLDRVMAASTQSF
jgi:colanic acid/amylovoran biosynthesis glycosyltransferase